MPTQTASRRTTVRRTKAADDAYCPHCHSADTEWLEASGRGHLYTWTTVQHQIHPAYPTPYTIVVVELDDAPEVRLAGQLPGAPALSAGMRMKVRFEPLEDGTVIPNWEPAN